MVATPPASVLPYLQAASKGTGIPLPLVEAQNYEETGYGANQGPSSAGALGPWQFEPSTYTGLGFPAGSETSWQESTQAYIKYMDQLLQQSGGNIYSAMEGYVSGSVGSSAGAFYSNAIFANAGMPTNTKAGQGTSATVPASGAGSPAGSSATQANFITNLPFPFGLFNGIGNAIGGGASGLSAVAQSAGLFGGFQGITGWVLKQFGINNIKDFTVRAGLIFLGAILLIIGVAAMASSPLRMDSEPESEAEAVTEPASSSPPAKPKSSSSAGSPHEAGTGKTSAGTGAGKASSSGTGSGTALRSLGKNAKEFAVVAA